jgi:hypothetical protein
VGLFSLFEIDSSFPMCGIDRISALQLCALYCARGRRSLHSHFIDLGKISALRNKWEISAELEIGNELKSRKASQSRALYQDPGPNPPQLLVSR